MAAVADIVISDAQATPVAHTFTPARQSGDIFTWTDRVAGVVAGFRVISIGTRFATIANSGQKVTIKIVDPRLAQTSPSSGSGVQPNPVAAYSTMATIEFLLPPAADLQARKDILAYVKNLLANSQVTAMIQDLSAPY